MSLRLAALDAFVALERLYANGWANNPRLLDEHSPMHETRWRLRRALGIDPIYAGDDGDLDAIATLEAIAQRLEGKPETASLAAAIHQAVGAHKGAGEALKQAAE